MRDNNKSAFVVHVDLEQLQLPRSGQERVAEQLARAVLSEIVLTQPDSITIVPAITEQQKNRFHIPQMINGGIIIRHLDRPDALEGSITQAIKNSGLVIEG